MDNPPVKRPLKRLNVYKVTADDFIRFLAHKTSDDDPCPVCSEDNWGVLCPSGDSSLTYRFGTQVRNVDPSFFVSTFAYYCLDCGFMRHHMARVVYDWVTKNPVDTPVVARTIQVPMEDFDE